MKLTDKRTDEVIACPKCKGVKFTDFDMRTETTTFQIWCMKKDCNTDLLIPVKDVQRGVIVKTK